MRTLFEEVIMSDHADMRINQRGIPLRSIELIVREGDIVEDAEDGACAVSISERKANRLRKAGVDSRYLERALGVTVIMYGPRIATAYHGRDAHHAIRRHPVHRRTRSARRRAGR
jgi:hypothetical protein